MLYLLLFGLKVEEERFAYCLLARIVSYWSSHARTERWDFRKHDRPWIILIVFIP